ncbi:hypothetical protein [Butyrivibrio sp. M55]|uniref:hypothetical protein n=1 Tax=Butyrivibrio sp. M55 TaxID=1855323 RepID=UPI0008E6F62C|nr:hypothetical protein [Butyrivibrio sp. M55]SFU91685.1 hypothetical protein SAMN05216540_1216 [Butyrivibrio sp. M55]
MEEEKRDYRQELREIKIERENVQSRYAGIRKELEAQNEELVHRMNKEYRDLEYSNINNDPVLVDIYERRAAFFRRSNNNISEFYDSLEQKERKLMDELDKKEYKIKKEMSSDEK